jgi:hypothetical protein
VGETQHAWRHSGLPRDLGLLRVHHRHERRQLLGLDSHLVLQLSAGATPRHQQYTRRTAACVHATCMQQARASHGLSQSRARAQTHTCVACASASVALATAAASESVSDPTFRTDSSRWFIAWCHGEHTVHSITAAHATDESQKWKLDEGARELGSKARKGEEKERNQNTRSQG